MNWDSSTVELIINSLTVLISAVSAISVVVLSVNQSKLARKEKQQQKKDALYRSEVISERKLNEHIDVELDGILKNNQFTKLDKCKKLNDAMLTFFYRSLNYMAFFNLAKYNELKLKIMAEIDNMMYSVLMYEEELPEEKAEKILEIYKMKLIYLFHDYEMSLE
ncbi:MAG: hypothetical protein IKY44_01515 [Clostridia bacterium]|nr:hypothetical protein [Clostridia bacterium]